MGGPSARVRVSADFVRLHAEVSLYGEDARVRRDTTRLETRTKECTTAASQRVLKPEGAVKAMIKFC